jgi:hypothetical protein
MIRLLLWRGSVKNLPRLFRGNIGYTEGMNAAETKPRLIPLIVSAVLAIVTFRSVCGGVSSLVTFVSTDHQRHREEPNRELEQRQPNAIETEQERQKDAETLKVYLGFLRWVEPRRAEPLSEQQIRSLIAELASPLPAPKVEYGTAMYPEGSNRQAYKEAKGPWGRLRQAGTQAFPYLFESLSDDRYSFTEDAGENDYNWMVGRACFDVVRCQIEPWDNNQLPVNGKYNRRRPRYTDRLLHNPRAAKAWWETHKQLSIHDLQLEILQWVIAEEAKMPEKYSSSEREYLNALLTNLQRGTTIYPPTRPWSI